MRMPFTCNVNSFPCRVKFSSTKKIFYFLFFFSQYALPMVKIWKESEIIATASVVLIKNCSGRSKFKISWTWVEYPLGYSHSLEATFWFFLCIFKFPAHFSSKMAAECKHNNGREEEKNDGIGLIPSQHFFATWKKMLT